MEGSSQLESENVEQHKNYKKNNDDQSFSREKKDHYKSSMDKERNSSSGIKHNECENEIGKEGDSSPESLLHQSMANDAKEKNIFVYRLLNCFTNKLGIIKYSTQESESREEENHQITSKIVSRRPLIQKKDVSNKYEFFNKIEEYKWYITVILTVIIAIAAAYGFTPNKPIDLITPNKTANNIIQQKIIFEKYPSNKRLLKELFFLIDYVNNSALDKAINEPITILYTHKKTAECLANDIAKYAADVFHNSNEFEKLNGSEMDENFSLSCNFFRDNINKKGVLVVYNFQNMPVDKVRLFHAICDRYSPFSKNKCVFIILLEINENQKDAPRLMDKLYSRMYELWSSYLEQPFLEPIIVRLSETIVDIKEEKELLDC